MSIEKTGRGGHITVNGIRLTDMQKYKKFEQTNTTKKKRKNKLGLSWAKLNSSWNWTLL